MNKELMKIKNMIYELRGQKVMLDSDLAALYEVETKVLNQAVKRNIKRFPSDFMFQLTTEEWENLRSQFVTLKEGKNEVVTNCDQLDSANSRPMTEEEWHNLRYQFGTFKNVVRKYKPYVFTEQGVAMLAAVLKSQKAIDINIQIMRAFVQLRHYVLGKDTNLQIAELRELLMLYMEKNDERVNDIIIALNNLIEHPKPTRRIGFNAEEF